MVLPIKLIDLKLLASLHMNADLSKKEIEQKIVDNKETIFSSIFFFRRVFIAWLLWQNNGSIQPITMEFNINYRYSLRHCSTSELWQRQAQGGSTKPNLIKSWCIWNFECVCILSIPLEQIQNFKRKKQPMEINSVRCLNVDCAYGIKNKTRSKEKRKKERATA